MPVEVIVGAGDRVLSPRNSRVLSECLPNARLTILEDTGHAIPFERPMEILQRHHAARRCITADGGWLGAVSGPEERRPTEEGHEQQAVQQELPGQAPRSRWYELMYVRSRKAR